ncbi:MAG: carboxypeptidase M32, partial [Halobacteria archaeon]|nr:carboxypeptidase M32 [Halobacteria archaeon]
MAKTDADSKYDELLKRVKKISNVSNAAGVLQWDQEVMMPEGGTPARSQQLSTLSSVQHELLTADETGELLDEVDGDGLDGEKEAVVREVRREYERATRVPNELVEEISRTTSEALPEWKEAKANSDFEAFAPRLEKLVELKKEYAEHINPDKPPYEVLFEDFEPYLGIDIAERVLERLRDELVPLIDDVRGSDAEITTDAFDGTFSEEAQESLVRDALDTLGYDWEHGRL